jgi:putative ABC transport system ATP-binding protein
MFMEHEEAILEGRRLCRSFGQRETLTRALRDVSVEFQRGRLYLIMGPSGSGKSTLLAALCGLLRPDGGEVVALGQDLWQLSPHARERFRLRHFSFIFQGFNLFPELTALQQLEIVLRWGDAVPVHESRRQAAETLAQLDLANKVCLRPHQLSGGEKQRVAIARALVKNPDICFADEPTSSLDWEHGKQVVTMLQRAACERRTTVVVVSHDARIVSYADRVFHLEDGQLRESPGHAKGEISHES